MGDLLSSCVTSNSSGATTTSTPSDSDIIYACYYNVTISNVNITGYKAGWIILGLPSIIDFVHAWQHNGNAYPTICATMNA